ncbi:uncharacterized protein LOC125179364 [Hyalella azteca]|uniref:Uncharacterized protein LOC125179364 n=1 Tax=Hyalella azteca TaxID=294128 RepID=A0A979FX85_HYAAZ|nr:uncharacterized protein LOC125179364 [Hyalella azteca]
MRGVLEGEELRRRERRRERLPGLGRSGAQCRARSPATWPDPRPQSRVDAVAMEWANGDVRINLVRGGPFSRVPDRGDPSNVGATREEYSPKSQTRIPMSAPQPSREEFKPNPNYYQHTAPATYGIVHPDYKISSKRYCDVSLPKFGLEREDSLPPRSSDYPSLQRGFGASAFTAPASDDSCSQVCSECPGGGAPCDYGPPSEPGYPMVEIHSSCMPPEPPESYTLDMGGVVSGVGVSDDRSVQSHASHCDIRDFEEWRGLRGSHESLGSLPPDLQRHLQNCRCPCDHLGYGNYQTLLEGGRVSHISRSLSEAAAAVYGGARGPQDDPSGASSSSCGPMAPGQGLQGGPDYTQLSFLDSPRSTSSNGFPTRRKVQAMG